MHFTDLSKAKSKLRGKLKLLIAASLGAGVTISFQACGAGFSALSFSSFSSTENYSGGGGSVTVNWAANREAAVNSVGGGYRVYYTQSSALSPTAPSIDILYASGVAMPLTATISGLVAGSYNIYVVAYSALKTTGSTPSTVVTVNVK